MDKDRTKTQARQGRPEGVVRWVLLIGTLLGVVVLGIILLVFV